MGLFLNNGGALTGGALLPVGLFCWWGFFLPEGLFLTGRALFTGGAFF